MVMKTVLAGRAWCRRSLYDGVGRATTSYLTDGGGDSGYSDADDVTGDTVLEQSETTYDDDGLPLSTLHRLAVPRRLGHRRARLAIVGHRARVSYAGYYYDASSGRLTATVDVGTNGGSAWTRPGSVPSRSDTVLGDELQLRGRRGADREADRLADRRDVHAHLRRPDHLGHRLQRLGRDGRFGAGSALARSAAATSS